MTEPSLSPLKPFGGSAKRQPPIYDQRVQCSLGLARVRVVPITGLSIEHVRFEVIADWTGRGVPPLEPDARADVACQDVYNVGQGYQEQALAIARATTELLREGQVPFLRQVATAIKLYAGGWRSWYADEIGDDWRAWAP